MKCFSALPFVLLLAAMSPSLACGQPRKKPDAAQAFIKTLPGEHQKEIRQFFALLEGGTARQTALKHFDHHWKAEHLPIFIEFLSFIGNEDIVPLLEQKTGQRFAADQNKWFEWLWSEPRPTPPYYANLKATFYSLLDPRFVEYFDDQPTSRIRLDEIRWGGVRRDGIPPLEQPKMITAEDRQARYLGDGNVVFGISINGDHRAYPKRILAWHEMFRDQIGGREINGVYCTLCGSMIVYDTIVDGTHHELGTSGFLYRSNKLMYDKATKSMWSTLDGEPVLGPLVGKGIKLRPLHVVTTTWGEWRKQHPGTTVLSLDTGHRRDYDEGAAYRAYFATDELMFTVPKTDTRLKNKDEVLIPRFTAAADPLAPPTPPLAISAALLRRQPIYHERLGTQPFVVLTDAGGGNRIYERPASLRFEKMTGGNLNDSDGKQWTISENQLRAVASGKTLERLPAHRAFWFGWYAVHPDTLLRR